MTNLNTTVKSVKKASSVSNDNSKGRSTEDAKRGSKTSLLNEQVGYIASSVEC